MIVPTFTVMEPKETMKSYDDDEPGPRVDDSCKLDVKDDKTNRIHPLGTCDQEMDEDTCSDDSLRLKLSDDENEPSPMNSNINSPALVVNSTDTAAIEVKNQQSVAPRTNADESSTKGRNMDESSKFVRKASKESNSIRKNNSLETNGRSSPGGSFVTSSEKSFRGKFRTGREVAMCSRGGGYSEVGSFSSLNSSSSTYFNNQNNYGRRRRYRNGHTYSLHRHVRVQYFRGGNRVGSMQRECHGLAKDPDLGWPSDRKPSIVVQSAINTDSQGEKSPERERKIVESTGPETDGALPVLRPKIEPCEEEGSKSISAVETMETDRSPGKERSPSPEGASGAKIATDLEEEGPSDEVLGVRDESAPLEPTEATPEVLGVENGNEKSVTDTDLPINDRESALPEAKNPVITRKSDANGDEIGPEPIVDTESAPEEVAGTDLPVENEPPPVGEPPAVDFTEPEAAPALKIVTDLANVTDQATDSQQVTEKPNTDAAVPTKEEDPPVAKEPGSDRQPISEASDDVAEISVACDAVERKPAANRETEPVQKDAVEPRTEEPKANCEDEPIASRIGTRIGKSADNDQEKKSEGDEDTSKDPKWLRRMKRKEASITPASKRSKVQTSKSEERSASLRNARAKNAQQMVGGETPSGEKTNPNVGGQSVGKKLMETVLSLHPVLSNEREGTRSRTADTGNQLAMVFTDHGIKTVIVDKGIALKEPPKASKEPVLPDDQRINSEKLDQLSKNIVTVTLEGTEDKTKEQLKSKGATKRLTRLTGADPLTRDKGLNGIVETAKETVENTLAKSNNVESSKEGVSVAEAPVIKTRRQSASKRTFPVTEQTENNQIYKRRRRSEPVPERSAKPAAVPPTELSTPMSASISDQRKEVPSIPGYVRELFERDANGKLVKLKTQELEALLLQKIVETITMRSEIGKLREQARISERNQEATRQRCHLLAKQIKDFEMVLARNAAERKNNNDKPVPPIKINRSVGLQVNFTSEYGMQNLRTLMACPQPWKQNVTITAVPGLAPITPPAPPAPVLPQNGAVAPVTEKSPATRSSNSPRSFVKVRSPRRADVPTSLPAPSQPQVNVTTTVASKATEMTHPSTAAVSNVAPPTASVIVQTQNAAMSVAPVAQQAPTLPLGTKMQNILVGGKITVQSSPPKSVLNSSKTTPNDLIDLTEEEDKANRVVNNPQNVMTIVPSSTPSPIAPKVPAPRLQRILQTLPGNLSIQPRNIRVVQNANQPTPTALVNNINATRLAYVMQANPGASRQLLIAQNGNQLRPVTNPRPQYTTTTYKPGPTTIANGNMRPQMTTNVTPNLQAALSLHPAPLPETPCYPLKHDWKSPPPPPSLKISKVKQGIILSWNMALSDAYADIASYQLYAYQEIPGTPPSTSLWKKVGDVRALPLPMACTLKEFTPGNKYHFAVRAVDSHTRLGQYSAPGNIAL